MFSGDIDTLAVPEDVEFITNALGDNVVFHKQIHGSHGTFVLGPDMSFFSDDAVNLLQEYNPTPTFDIEFLS